MRKILLISMLSLFVFCSTGYAEMVDNDDGTVTDTKTGLLWQKAETGQNARSLKVSPSSVWRKHNANFKADGISKRKDRKIQASGSNIIPVRADNI